MQLKSMSLDRLVDLRGKVETALKARIMGARSELESRLKELPDLGGAPKIRRGGPRGRVPPKYRNPENPGETWTGRGLPPRWLAAALKRGARLEDFLIDGRAKQQRKSIAKARKAKAARKQAKPRKAAASPRKAVAKSRKAAKPGRPAKPRKAAKSRRAVKPPGVETTRSSGAASAAPAPASVDQSAERSPAA